MKKLAFLVFACYLVLAASRVSAASLGFIQGTIWYSKDPFFSGDTVRIYSAVLNGTSDDIIGSVSFYDNGKEIGKTPFTAASSGRLQEVWLDWQATEGEHEISARINNAFITKAGEANKPAAISNSESGRSERFVDLDTDKDGVGNKTDADDDGDGVSDEVELSKGTDPLKKDLVISNETASAKEKVGGSDFSLPNFKNKEVEAAVASVAETINTNAFVAEDFINKEIKKTEDKILEIKKKETTLIANENTRKIESLAGKGVATTTRTESQLGDTAKRLFLELYRYLLIVVAFVLAHKVILYLLLAYILYKVLRFIFISILNKFRYRD